MLFKICPYVQCGLIIALIVAGISLVGTALLSCFWLHTPPTKTATLHKQRAPKQAKKCNILLVEGNTNKMTKTNVCIVPLLTPTPRPKPIATTVTSLTQEDKTKTFEKSGVKLANMMMLITPQVDQQKSKSTKLKQQLKDKFSQKDNTLLPFLQNEFMTT